jgi:hypothetical protein
MYRVFRQPISIESLIRIYVPLSFVLHFCYSSFDFDVLTVEASAQQQSSRG